MTKEMQKGDIGERLMLSMNERDRRWGLAKQLMKAKGLNCLIIFPEGWFEPYDVWFTNDNCFGVVVFPFEGEPCYMTWSPMHGTLRMLENRKRGIQPWVEDYRVVRPYSEIGVTILQEKGLASANIDVVGFAHRINVKSGTHQIPHYF